MADHYAIRRQEAATCNPRRTTTVGYCYDLIKRTSRRRKEINKKTGILEARDLAVRIQNQFIENEDADGGYSLQMGETDLDYFRETVQSDSDPPSTKAPKIRTHRNILRARQLLYEQVTTVTGQIHAHMDALRGFGRGGSLISCL